MFTLPEFIRLAKNFHRVPLWTVWKGLPDDPVLFCERLASKNPQGFLLDSGAPSVQGRYIYFSASPPAKTVELTQDIVTWGPGRGDRRPLEGSPLDLLKPMLGEPCSMPGGLPPFWGGAVGYLGYDLAPYFESGLKGLAVREDPLGLPHLAMGFYDEIIALDLQERKTILMVSLPGGRGLGAREYSRLYDETAGRLLKLEQKVKRAQEAGPAPETPTRGSRSPKFKTTPDEKTFIRMVEQAKRAIERGDIYQANLSLRFSGVFASDPWSLHRRLRLANPSPFAGFLWFPRFSMVSTSPELLLRVRGRRLVSRPIAGTRPRGDSPLEDRKMEGALLLSPKERAEHIMLVDLERNDLGRVCAAGSVRVSERMIIERYSHVMHIVSQVEGRLEPGRHPFEAVRALFPGGTISGCPKIRAVQAIRELEPLARGPFFGSAGWVCYSGDLDLNILIRTLVFKGGLAHLQAGAGIVADSDPRQEYLESLQKARVLLEALQTGRPARRPDKTLSL
jgi:anthranilate/para-aminobenzoate synthase component I